MDYIVFTLVHGTFARNARWRHTNAPLVKSLFTGFGPNTVVQTYGWSGGNSHSARLRAGAGLAGMIRATAAQYPTHKHILVAHSHGGNVVLYALKEIPDIPIDGAVCLGTPFITCKERRIASVPPILKALFAMVLIVAFLGYWTLLMIAVGGWIDLPRNVACLASWPRLWH
jgi:pimeloyl-ACP methyl ester carboxylesterase